MKGHATKARSTASFTMLSGSFGAVVAHARCRCVTPRDAGTRRRWLAALDEGREAARA